MSVDDLLAAVNTLRAFINKAPLKSWKESASKLREIHDDLVIQVELHNTRMTPNELLRSKGATTAKEFFAEVKGHDDYKPRAKATKKAPTARKTAAEAPSRSNATGDDVMTIIAFAAAHGLSAKVVRARARKHADKLAAHATGKHAYRMTTEVVALLKGGK